MPLKDILRKKEKVGEDAESGGDKILSPTPNAPEFTFVRTTTTTQEVISPPDYPGDQTLKTPPPQQQTEKRKSLFHRRHSNNPSPTISDSEGRSGKEHRFSQRLQFGSRSRPNSPSSPNLPPDLPTISSELVKNEDDEVQWEKRATLLAQRSPLIRGNSSPHIQESRGSESRSRSRSVSVGDPGGDVRLSQGRCSPS